MPPAKPFLVIGPIQFIRDKLSALSVRGYDMVNITPGPKRQELLDALEEVRENRFVVIVLLSPNPSWGILGETVFAPFKGSLKFITGIGAGYDHMDIQYLTHEGVYYANTPVAVAEPTSTTTVMLILQTIRDATSTSAKVRSDLFRTALPLAPDTHGLVVGIVGMGTIGKLVRDKVTALGMKVVYNNRHKLAPEDENGAKFLEFDDLLKEARLITLHCPLPPKQLTSSPTSSLQSCRTALSWSIRHEKQVSILPVRQTSTQARLICVIVDEEALVRAMQSGKVLRCGLDVFENEPKVHPWLISSERATLVPHIGAWVEGIYKTIEEEAYNNVAAWIETGVPNTPVNRPS